MTNAIISKALRQCALFGVCILTLSLVGVSPNAHSGDSSAVALDTVPVAPPDSTERVSDSRAVVRKTEEYENPNYRFWELYDPRSSVELRHPSPAGYTRIQRDSLTGFGRWVSTLPMRPASEPLLTAAGNFLAVPSAIGGNIDLDVASPRQDARGVLYRLILDYLWHMEREHEFVIATHGNDTLRAMDWFTGSFKTNHNRSKLTFTPGEQRGTTPEEIGKLWEFAASVTNYKGLMRDCDSISEDTVMPGDLFIQYDTGVTPPIGHVVIILDVATLDISPAKEKPPTTPARRIFLAANSWTPATSFHILKPLRGGDDYWFRPVELAHKLAAGGLGGFYRLPYNWLK